MTHTLLFAETVEPRCFIRVGWYRYSEEDTDEAWCCVKLKKNGMQSAFVSYCSLFLYNHVLKWWTTEPFKRDAFILTHDSITCYQWMRQQNRLHLNVSCSSVLTAARCPGCMFIPAIRVESLGQLKWEVIYTIPSDYKNLTDANWPEGDRLKVSFWLKVSGRKTQDFYSLLAVLWVISSWQTSKFHIMRLLIKKMQMKENNHLSKL